MQMREDIVFTRHNTKMQLNVELLKTNTKKTAAPNNVVVVSRYCYVYVRIVKKTQKYVGKNGFNIFFFNPKSLLKMFCYGASKALSETLGLKSLVLNREDIINHIQY